MTHEEINELYHFTVLKKVLMRTYPWIKDVKLPEDINKYSLIFLDVIFDPWELAKEKDWTVKFYVRVSPIEWSPYLSTFFTQSQEVREFMQVIGNVIDKVQKSPAIPQDMKLPKSRKFEVGTWIASPDSIKIPEYTETRDNAWKNVDTDNNTN